jgi:hypothetical protein
MNPTKTTLDRPLDEQHGLDKQHGAATGLSDAWFSMARSGQEHSLQAARQFIDLVDAVLPVQGGEDSHRRRLIDGAFDLADRVGAAELGMMRSAVQSAVLFDVDVNVNVDTDVDAFNGVEVGVNVPTDVHALSL